MEVVVVALVVEVVVVALVVEVVVVVSFAVVVVVSPEPADVSSTVPFFKDTLTLLIFISHTSALNSAILYSPAAAFSLI